MKNKTVVAIAGGGEKIYEMIDSFNEEIQFDLFTVEIPNRVFGQNINVIKASDDDEIAALAVSDILQGADILFKGLIQTHTLLKAVLQHKQELVKSPVLSHVSILHIPEISRPILLTDAAMNIEPNFEQSLAIIENAVSVAHDLGIDHPKTALLSAAENFNPKMPSSVWSRELTQHYQSYPIESDVFGPISFDLALSSKIAHEKKFTGPIVGDADILVVPNLDVGNVLYKSLTLFTKTQVGGLIVGAKVPIVLTSRGDKLENKRASLEFAFNVI